jgi:hypothetical protein
MVIRAVKGIISLTKKRVSRGNNNAINLTMRETPFIVSNSLCQCMDLNQSDESFLKKII